VHKTTIVSVRIPTEMKVMIDELGINFAEVIKEALRKAIDEHMRAREKNKSYEQISESNLFIGKILLEQERARKK